MIADMMNIVPVRVWIFWIFVIHAATLWFGYKFYSNIRKDIVKLAKIFLGEKQK